MRAILRLTYDVTPSRAFTWGYDVRRAGVPATRVYLSSPVTASEVQESLVHYDGYPNDTTVRRGPRFIIK